MLLYLIRHPQPVLDQHTCYGRSDIAVAPHMLQPCLDSLLPLLPRDVPIFSSPLQRCAGLARALATRLGQAQVVLEHDLLEMDFGHWELRRWDDIPWDEVEAWNQDLLHHAPGGGETLPAMARRIWRALQNLRTCAAPAAIVVCHAGSIRMLHACAAWRDEQLAQLATGSTPLPDARAWEDIALRAMAQRRQIGFGEMLRLTLAPP
ncbi:MAG TPA: histidine phosphatase family protein [Herbaspirillum sp.]|uniref:histidine phosphatase family protein n=1 Tax=Herbaspirillum sp. TaxID=1890675 RepID=UPI002D2E9DCD|nr:histidine phosphatase family protein [Herbaspirillum sp.]HZG21234.1 histidine phosphatase family protein [Herbaspirillum sp.]